MQAYDYIIVGAGSAGCVLASRLSADPAARVLLLAELLPYFRKSQHQSRGASDLHGAGGPIAVSDMERHELADAFIDSAAAVGLPRNPDFNGETQEGTGYYQCTTLNGRRSSTAVGYLREAEKRPNLTVLTEALVSKVVFDRKRAAAIQFTKEKQTLEAKANREIILCGGAFNSPQLLQLSGVGAGALLQQNGIPVVHEAPEVGEGLQDHFYARTFWRCNRPITLNDDMASWLRQAKIGLQWLLLKRGPLTIAAGYAAAFVRTRPELKRPDAQIYFINFSTAKRGGILHPFSGFTLSVSQLQVESRGSVRIRSNDPAAPPAIRYNYLATENDRRVMIGGIRWIRRIAAAKPLADYIAAEESPSAKAQSDEELLAYLRDYGDTVFHPTSTCRMGTDDRSVVDSQLHVRGVERLRVADASVMPAVVSGNTNAAVIAIAEKAADLIRRAQM